MAKKFSWQKNFGAKKFRGKTFSCRKIFLKTILFDKIRGKKISWQKIFVTKFFFENNTIRQNSWQKIVVAKTYRGKNFFLKTIQYNLIALTLYVANLEI